MNPYDELIYLKWPKEDCYKARMPLCQRAKIFLPFAALKGYEEALSKKREEYIIEFEGGAKLLREEKSSYKNFDAD